MAAQPESDEGINAINVTPLVDIMLVLLIIFMVTTTYITAPSIKIELPEATSGGPTESSMLGLMLAQDGSLLLNGDRITEAALRAYIQSDESGDPAEIQAIIAADRNCLHGDVVHLIDLIKQEGVVKFAINIDLPEEGGASARGQAAAPSAGEGR